MELLNNLLLLPSENPSSTLILKGDYFVDYSTECLSRVKEKLFEDCKSAKYNKDENIAETYGMTLELKDVHTFLCHVDDQNNERAPKRKLLRPLNLSFVMRNYICFNADKNIFSTYGVTRFRGREIFMTVSYQDIVNIASAFVYNMKMIEEKYFAKLTKFRNLKGQGLEISAIEELKDEYSSPDLQEANPFELVLEKSASQVGVPEDNIFTVLQKAFKAMEQLGKASKAMSKYKSKVLEYTQTGVKSVFKSSTMSMHKMLESKNDLLEELKDNHIQDLTIINTVYEKLHDKSEMSFTCLKIVSVCILV